MADIIVVGADGIPVMAKDMGNGTFQIASQTTIVGSLASDGLTPAGSSIAQTPMLFNETTWDRQRGNTQGTLLASASRISSVWAPLINNFNAKGIALYLNVSSVSGTTPTIILNVYYVDPVSGQAFQFTQSNSLSAVGEAILFVYPSQLIANVGSVSFTSAPIPRNIQVLLAIGGTTPSFTCSVGYSLIL